MNFFVTAIGTDSGKTFVSAVLCEALEADYWKPIQAGKPFDSEVVKNLISNNKSIIHKESYALDLAASPHASAKKQNIKIDLNKIVLPQTANHLIVEGAGGCYVPINDSDFVIDIARVLNIKTILVSNYYLGSINHTLLTYDVLKKKNIQLEGIIFNGERNEETRRIILHHTKLPCLLDIETENIITRDVVKKYATQLNENWNPKLD
jgi:dethiobiotin synthetase